MRAALAACLVSLGASHNRFKVLRYAAWMIQGEKEPVEVLALVELLETAPETDLKALAEYVKSPQGRRAHTRVAQVSIGVGIGVRGPPVVPKSGIWRVRPWACRLGRSGL